MRHFWLERNGKVWDLTSNNENIADGNFFGSPDGLGVKVKIDAFEIENTAFIEKINLESGEIGGKLYFVNYEHFAKFAEFVGNFESSETMKLYYSTEKVNYFDSKNPQWYKLVLIKELTKSEINAKQGCLVCNIKFATLSRWKKDKTVTLELSRFGDIMTYPYYYPYYYGGRNNVAVEIDNTDNLPTSCIVKIEAETDTPFFRILQNNEVVEQARYNVFIRTGSYMVIDSSAEKQEASLYTTVGDSTIREDIYHTGERDYTFTNFITIPSGKSMFLISATNTDFGKVTLSYSLQKELI